MKYLLSGMLICVCFLSVAQDRITGKTFATRSEVIAQHGMAATSQPLATQVALDILKKGGNAIDCLLYTSPSPRDGLLSRMPSSA